MGLRWGFIGASLGLHWGFVGGFVGASLGALLKLRWVFRWGFIGASLGLVASISPKADLHTTDTGQGRPRRPRPDRARCPILRREREARSRRLWVRVGGSAGRDSWEGAGRDPLAGARSHLSAESAMDRAWSRFRTRIESDVRRDLAGRAAAASPAAPCAEEEGEALQVDGEDPWGARQ